MFRSRLVILFSLGWISAANAASIDCPRCEAWNKDQLPFQVFDNTYYVGTHGLSALLITSPAGHVLIDGALPQSAPLIARNVEQLGFKMSDVKVILNSHVHVDHAGGIAELQKMSGATVFASDIAAGVLRSGEPHRSDPQFLRSRPYPRVDNVEALGERRTIEVGSLQLHVVHTPGHTPGGTSWTWQSCENGRCLSVVYADSVHAVSDDSFKYGGDERYPNAAADMLSSIAALDALPCDIIIVPHPELGALWSVFNEQGEGDRNKLVDPSSCKRYAATAQERFNLRLQNEKK